MGCNNLLTDRTCELIDASLRGENSGIHTCSPEVREEIEKMMPEVERVNREDSERRLCFEDNPDKREIFKEDLSPKDRERADQQRAQQEVVRFRTLDGEFTIRHSPGSHLTAEEVKRLYREDTPHAVTRHMEGEAFVNREKISIGKDGKLNITLGEHGIRKNDKGVNLIYEHPERVLKVLRPDVWQRKDPAEMRQALKEIEIETRHHEIGEAIYDRNLTVEEMDKCDKMCEEAVKGGWMRKICTHSEPTSRQYTCDSYKMFKTDPPRLKELHPEMFQFIQQKYISLEVEDTFASLEREEE